MPSRTAAEWFHTQLAALLLATGAFFAPIRQLMIAVAILIALDAMTGILAAWKAGAAITSARMRDTVIKALVYQACVVTGALLEQQVFGGSFPAAKMVGTLIVAVEAKSILENGERIAGRPLFRAVTDKLKSRDGGEK